MVDRFHEVDWRSDWTAVAILLTIGIRGSLDETAWSGHLARLADKADYEIYDAAAAEINIAVFVKVKAAAAAIHTVFT